MTPWQPDRTDEDFFRTSRRPSKSATCEKDLGAGFETQVLSLLMQTLAGFLSGIIRQNWNDTEKISMAPAQG